MVLTQYLDEQRVEVINHIVRCCPILLQKEYKDQFHQIGRYIYWKICQYQSVSYAEKWYGDYPEPVTESHEVTILRTLFIPKKKHMKATFSTSFVCDQT